jgi:hypothetical protein
MEARAWDRDAHHRWFLPSHGRWWRLGIRVQAADGAPRGRVLGMVMDYVMDGLLGSLMIDGWARRGIVASEFFPDRYRPGKRLVDDVVALLSE